MSIPCGRPASPSQDRSAPERPEAPLQLCTEDGVTTGRNARFSGLCPDGPEQAPCPGQLAFRRPPA